MKNKTVTNNIFNSWKLMVGTTQEKNIIWFISIVVPKSKISELLE